jgi:hypothetical protein
MTTHHRLPVAADLVSLAGAVDPAVSIYVATSPDPTGRQRARTAFKSALDEVGGQVGEATGIVAQGEQILADEELWGTLSRGLAVFLSADRAELFVLPNRVDDQVSVGRRFELGQAWRSVSQQQEALALTLSAAEWQLWHATPQARIAPVELDGEYPADAGRATKRASAGREDDRLSGDPYDLYAKRVADAATSELAAIDPEQRLTLFVFGDERLIHLLAERKDGRRIVGLPGNPDRVGADELDATVRGLLDELNVADTKAELAALADGDPGSVERDLAAIARMAVKGGVDTYWFDYSAPVPGTLDPTSGELVYAEDAAAPEASDLLAQVALLVHESGGRVVAVRPADLGEAWAGPAIARLRFSLA